MYLLKNPGSTIYGLATLAAFLCGGLKCMVLLVGFAYSGLAGDAPGDASFTRYSIVAATGTLGTIILFVGLLGTSSHRRVFSILTMVGTASLVLITVPYAAFAVRGQPLAWTLLAIMIELASLTLSALKLLQLRTIEAPSWPQ